MASAASRPGSSRNTVSASSCSIACDNRAETSSIGCSSDDWPSVPAAALSAMTSAASAAHMKRRDGVGLYMTSPHDHRPSSMGRLNVFHCALPKFNRHQGMCVNRQFTVLFL